MISEHEAIDRAASICSEHAFFYDPATARAELTRSDAGDLQWRVTTGTQTKHWLDQETDDPGVVLVLDANSGEFLGVATIRGLIAAQNLQRRPRNIQR